MIESECSTALDLPALASARPVEILGILEPFTWIHIGYLGYELGLLLLAILNFLIFASAIRRTISFMVTVLFCRAIWHLASFGKNLLSSSSGHKNEAHYFCVHFYVLKT